MKEEKKKKFCVRIFPKNQSMQTRWFVEYYEETFGGNGRKRVRIYGNINREKTVSSRLAKAQEIIRSLGEIEPVRETPLLDALEKHRSNYRPKSYQTYKSRIAYFEAWRKNTPAGAITPERARKFILHLQESGLASASVWAYRVIISRAYTLAGIADPFAGIKVKKEVQGLDYFRSAEISLLKKTVQKKDPETWLFVQFIYYCFIRPGELRFLQVGAIDFEFGTIEIPGSISKNKKTERIAIPDAFLRELDPLKNAPAHYYIFGAGGGPGTSPRRKDFFYKRFRPYIQAVVKRENLSLYSWKHTGVVSAVRAGVNLVELQRQLRHHSLEMVFEYVKRLGLLEMEGLRLRFPDIGT